MERTLVLSAAVPVPRGNRVEITQMRPRLTGEEPKRDDDDIVAVRDLNRGIGYRLRDAPRDRVDVWTAQVRECTVTHTARGPQTVLTLVTADPAQSAADALSEADAAAAAAKAESDRWGGSDRPRPDAPERFW